MAFDATKPAGATKIKDSDDEIRANFAAIGVVLPNLDAGGGQVKFPAEQAVSGNANTLDDYEEGDWTATLACGTSGTITLDAEYATGAYTKVGRMVTITGQFLVDSVSSPVGTLTLNTLPFFNGGGKKYVTSVNIWVYALEATGATQMMGRINDSAEGILIYHYAAGVAAAAAADIKATSQIVVNATYFTA